MSTPGTPPEEQTATPAWTKPRLTFRRLSGLDRSGPPPPQTLAGQPWNVWTIPNGIGLIRFLLLPVFLIVAFSTDDGKSVTAALIFMVIAVSDYADGIAARVTGQYSRLGTLLDPLIDRLLILAGVVVCFNFELLPRWALIVLGVREFTMLVFTRWSVGQGIELRINWLGRSGVWPVMAAPGLAMVSAHTAALICLYIGMALALGASLMYFRDARREFTLKDR